MTRHGHQVVDGEDKKFRFNTHKQRKHHRWCLDAGQIYSYALSGALDPAKKWWEAIEVSGRTLTVLELQRGLSVVPLICEDLARQEPMGTIVRSIGPSLVLALLMDGPQYRERWSGNYATVLADDPGSSVLTLTSRGMVERWNSPHAPSRSVVALWKEAGRPARELEVGAANALLLTLGLEDAKEFAADGRSASRTRLVLREVLRIGP